jgi:hypothetical protein
MTLETHADATLGERQVFGSLTTYGGGAVYHNTQNIALIVNSSMEAEAHATGKGGELVCYARTVLRALGVPQLTPTLLGTNNLANRRIGLGIGCPARSKHFLRRYMVLQQRIANQEVDLRHIVDADMPADFLTKWISASKSSRRASAMRPTPTT